MSMLGTDFDDISPVTRSREENQERAFVAASRRKDRSLDARLESANRASLLHKKRTGKALHITREIVEKEAMYEEVDERYQEKRLRMLQAQNMQIEKQFQRQLLAAFTAGANSSRQQVHSPSISHEHGGQELRVDIASASQNLWPSCPTPPSPAQMTPPYDSATSSPDAAYVSQIQSPCLPLAQNPAILAEVYASRPQIAPGYFTPSVSPAWGITPESTSYPNLSSNASRLGESRCNIPRHPSWNRSAIPQPNHATFQGASMDGNHQPFRQRVASLSDHVHPLTTPLAVPSEEDDQSNDRDYRAKSEPLQAQLLNVVEPSPTDLLAAVTNDGNTLPEQYWATPALSLSPSTSDSSPVSSIGDQVFISPAAMGFSEHLDVISPMEFDPEFYDFNQFASALGTGSQHTAAVVEPNTLIDWSILNHDMVF